MLGTPLWPHKGKKKWMNVLCINSNSNVVQYHQEYFFNDPSKQIRPEKNSRLNNAWFSLQKSEKQQKKGARIVQVSTIITSLPPAGRNKPDSGTYLQIPQKYFSNNQDMSKRKGCSFSKSEIARKGTEEHFYSGGICPVSIISIPLLPAKTSETAEQLVMPAACHWAPRFGFMP